MRLNEIRPSKGSTHARKRLGKGQGSGHGKTSGKGHKGQRSRSGRESRPWFEGGQMPLQRRLPARGFTNIFRKEYAIVNLDRLNTFPDDTVVTPKLLKSAGIIGKMKDGVKILGNGDLEKSLTVKAHRFSKSALSKVESAGGKTIII